MKIILFLGLLLMSQLSFSQTFSEVKLKSKEDIKAAEPMVLAAANYVLSKSFDNSDGMYLDAQRLLMTWMEKAEYTFSLTQKMVECCTKKNNLFGVYLASLVKGQLAFKEDFAKNGILEFVKFVENKELLKKQNKAIKKLIIARDSGDISAYLN